jgi:hypothetical protein
MEERLYHSHENRGISKAGQHARVDMSERKFRIAFAEFLDF